ncbi:cell division protein FtsX [Acuticoccus sp.]|uniref:cell division protein FtsX n=1 Tax=Acuticoccus sp. TaxID=1904378 RepID=UPI003B517F05
MFRGLRSKPPRAAADPVVPVHAPTTRDEDEPVAVEGAIVAPETVAGRGLTVIVAIMTFLCALLTGGAVLVERAAGAWSSSVLDEVTVTVLPLDGDPIEARVAQAQEVLSGAPGLAEVNVVSAREAGALLEPWLGDDVDLSALPVPRLVTAQRVGTFDAEATAAALDAVPGAKLDDHTGWSARLERMASAVALGTLAALGLMLVATAISIVFATRATIASNAATVEVLTLLGAEDRFVVRAFRRRFLAIGLRGALVGTAAALALFGSLELASWLAVGTSSAQSRALLGDPSLGALGYGLVAAVAVGVAVLVAVTSTTVVRRQLRRVAR